MTAAPRTALDRLIAALEAHLDVIEHRTSSDDHGVDVAYNVLSDAFDVYDDALAQEYGEVTPFVLLEDDDEEEDDDLDDDDDEDDDQDEGDVDIEDFDDDVDELDHDDVDDDDIF